MTADPASPMEKMLNVRQFMKPSAAEAEIDGPLTIDEAVAYAIKFNLDVRVQRMEEELGENQLLLTKLSMLPRLNAETNISSRNNETGASSQDIRTGRQNLSFSRSSPDDTQSSRLEASYNLLDYGLNYIRAQQDANRIQIAHERRKAAINALVRDARATYMQAAIAQKIEKEVSALTLKAEDALDRSRKAYADQLNKPLENLAYQRDLLVVIKNLKNLQTELQTAKLQLAKLLNIRMGKNFELADIDTQAPVKTIRSDLDQLEVYAVVNRPELAEEDFNLTIEKLEKRRVWLSMLPIIEPKITYNHEDNNFLLNSSWWSISSRIAYSLMQPFTLPTQLKNAEDRMAYVSLRRDALTLSVLSQVNIAYLQHRSALEALKTSTELASIEGQISEQIDNSVKTEIMSEQDSVLGQVKSLQARVERDLDYIAVDRSTLQLLTAIGYNTAPDNINDYDIKTLANMMSEKSNARLTNANNMKRYTEYNQVRDQMAYDASYATKSNRPWLIRIGPFPTQEQVGIATQDIAKTLIGLGGKTADFMPPVPYARLDDGDLGDYYLAFDNLNALDAHQVCEALLSQKMNCTVNANPVTLSDEKKSDSKWPFASLFDKK